MSLKNFLVGRSLKRTAIRIVFIVAGLYLLFGVIFSLHVTRGASMEPTITDGSIQFGNRLAYRFGTEIKRGDVVVVPMAGTVRFGIAKASYLKRVLGLPGEQVAFVNGQLMINREAFDEPWPSESTWDLNEFTLEENEFYLAGDNRGMSIKNHAQFRKTQDRILSKLLFTP